MSLPTGSTPLVLAPIDDCCHVADGHPAWQESCAFIWFDPERSIAGYQHLYLRPADDRAVLWGWHLDATGVHESSGARATERPRDDLTDLTVLGWRITSVDPLREYRSSASYGATTALVAYRAQHDPSAFTVPDLASGLEQHHYESVGRIDGTYNDGEMTSPIMGVGFHDHSWGVRSRPSGGSLSHQFGFGATADGHFVISRTGRGDSSWNHSYVSNGATREPIVDVTGLDQLHDEPTARVVLHTALGEHELTGRRVLATTVPYGADYGARCAFFAGTLGDAACYGMIELGG
ncbi:unannotated protein [freshwater metagenome]|uniref:Unannotated protein n=1 Tax=freshwater metagenome TaxID=449393 RepID=A0A6J7I1I9_9ZZZZ